MAGKQGFEFEIGRSHGNTQGLGLVRASDNTAIIIGEDNNGFAVQLRAKQSFTGNIKIITINEGKDFFH